MKKVMFGLAAAAAISTFAIESANVVGYNTLSTGYASQMLGAAFKNPSSGADGVTLSELQGDFSSYDEIQVAYMDGTAIEFVTYQYLTEDDGVDADGWYDGSWEPAGSVLIPRGAAVWFVSSSGTAKDVTTAGEVVASSTLHPAFVESSNMICSAYPVEFNPNASTVTWTGLTSYDEIQVAYMDGTTIEFVTYQYLTEDDGVDENAWYDGSWEKITAPIAGVGQGFWLIISDYENVTLTEVSPILAN